MKIIRAVVYLIIFLSSSIILDYSKVYIELKKDNVYDWNIEYIQPNSFFSIHNIGRYLYSEVIKICSSVKYQLSINNNNLNNKESINIYVPGKEEVRFKDDQRRRLNISTYKSQIIEKSSYKAFLVNESGDTSKIKLTNVGMNADHYNLSRGWTSFRIKFGKGNNSYGRKAKKSILLAPTRLNGMDYFANSLYKNLCDGIKISSSPINLIINGKEYDNFLIEDAWDKFLIESNKRREGAIFEVGFNGIIEGSTVLRKDSLYLVMNNTVPLTQDYIIEFAEAMNNGSPKINLIDTVKLDVLLLLCNDFFGYHPLYDINLHWYHNPVTNLFEPILREVQNTSNGRQIFEDTLNFFPAYYVQKRQINFENLRQKVYPNFNVKLKDEVLAKFIHIDRNRVNQIVELINKYKDAVDTPTNIKEMDTIRVNTRLDIFKDMRIEKDQLLLIEDGAEVIFSGNANLKVYGGFIIAGEDQRVKISAIGDNSIFVYSKIPCRITNADFTGFASLIDSANNHFLPSALTFYETTTKIDNSSFCNNTRGDDYINVFRCPEVMLTNCRFDNVLSDAVDSDFSNINVESCIFINIGNDAIDVSGSHLEINNTDFIDIYDKAVSGGESSTISIDSCVFKRNAIAVVSKDGSILHFTNCVFKNNDLDIAAFQKKIEYDQPEIYTTDDGDWSVLIEEKVETNLITKKTNGVKAKMYGREFGRATRK